MPHTRAHLRRFFAATSFVVLVASSAFALAAAPAEAAPQVRFVATTGNDSGNDCLSSASPCATIGHAIGQAQGGDTVSIGAGTFHENVRIPVSLTLAGAGPTGPGRTTIDGQAAVSQPSVWVESVAADPSPTVTIRDLDVSGNQASDGIRAANARVTVLHTIASRNRGAGFAAHRSSVTIAGSAISGNAEGGAVAEGGSIVTISTTTLDANVGVGVSVGGPDSGMTVRRSTISNTRAFSDDRGFGMGVLVLASTAVIDTSTIHGNTGQGVLSFVSRTTITNTTVSATLPRADLPPGPTGINDLPNAGVVVAGGGGPITATLTATIVADNSTLEDCNGAVADGGYNLAGDDSCGFGATGSVTDAAAKLGPLADNGGSTLTLLPATSSDALDAIPSGMAGCSSGALDQRGLVRLAPPGGTCDIGAVEVAQDVVPTTSTPVPPSTSHSSSVSTSPRPTVSITHHPSPTSSRSSSPSRTDPRRPSSSAAPSLTTSAAPIADTGSRARPLALLATVCIGLGALLLIAAGARRPARSRYRRGH